jgi:hypothetical protein
MGKKEGLASEAFHYRRCVGSLEWAAGGNDLQNWQIWQIC